MAQGKSVRKDNQPGNLDDAKYKNQFEERNDYSIDKLFE